jgi:alkanesulfonate monooxygenase SsuD/methylene tetrahydromethanopterin reductase-like flavin-dependent oxidoreductase (luciferase family)
MRLSVLDLVPVRTDQTTSDALAATTQLAQTADRLGYTRYWVAEHHNMPAVAATSPPVLIAHLAAAKGLPYVFAHHFSGQGTAEALAGIGPSSGRATWRPSRSRS